MTRALEETLGSAGAAFVVRGSRRVAAHFGSVPGEMAVCRHGVGLSDRSDAGKLELRGSPAAVSQLLERVIGQRLLPGWAVEAFGAWWCPVTRHRVLVVGDPRAVADLEVVLGAAAGVPGASTIDLSEDYAAINVIGPRAQTLVHEAGLLDGVLPVGGFAPRASTLRPSLLVREDVDRYLLLVPDAHGRAAWRHLMAAGRVHGATCVGREALDRLRACPRPVSVP
jgi:glycine cleavage system aminomethyltransferase T